MGLLLLSRNAFTHYNIRFKGNDNYYSSLKPISVYGKE